MLEFGNAATFASLGRCALVAVLGAVFGSLMPWLFLHTVFDPLRSAVWLPWLWVVIVLAAWPGLLAWGAIRHDGRVGTRRPGYWVQVELLLTFVTPLLGWHLALIWDTLSGGSTAWWPPPSRMWSRALTELAIVLGSGWVVASPLAFLLGRRRRRRQEGRCPRCGYSLQGLTSGRCPECGSTSS